MIDPHADLKVPHDTLRDGQRYVMGGGIILRKSVHPSPLLHIPLIGEMAVRHHDVGPGVDVWDQTAERVVRSNDRADLAGWHWVWPIGMPGPEHGLELFIDDFFGGAADNIPALGDHDA